MHFAFFILALLSLFPIPVHTVSGNYPLDLYGPVDTREAGLVCAGGPCIWGNADFGILPITFKAPAGTRVKILSLRGDVIAWIKSLPGDTPIPAQSSAGFLAGFQTSSASGSSLCDYCASGTPLYVQGSVTDKTPNARVGFDYNDVDTDLDADNVLHAKLASFLNTTGKPIHLELTYTIRFQFHPE